MNCVGDAQRTKPKCCLAIGGGGVLRKNEGHHLSNFLRYYGEGTSNLANKESFFKVLVYARDKGYI